MLEAIFVLYFCCEAVTGAILRHPSWKGEAMANEEQLALLEAGVEVWNEWRKTRPGEKIDLSQADLSERDHLMGTDIPAKDLERVLNYVKKGYRSLKAGYSTRADLNRANLNKADLREANLGGADLRWANFTGANLTGANLTGANLTEANLTEAKVKGANLTETNLTEANLTGANLRGSNLRGSNLSRANLSRANLIATDLTHCDLVEVNISNTKISKSQVYGISVWELEGEFKEQKDLVITRAADVPITVDNIKVAQFIYLILNNKEIRDVINTLTSKTVLILGRFTPERKAILDALRDQLREYDLLPIVFDFDRPADKDFTETIKTLAGLCYFVIADVTNPKSSPLELQATVPDYQIPFVPIIQEGERPFAMMVDLQNKYDWVLDTLSYKSKEELVKVLKPAIIDPAIQKHNELRLIKAREPKIRSAEDFIDKS
jgi:hypothetical protein